MGWPSPKILGTSSCSSCLCLKMAWNLILEIAEIAVEVGRMMMHWILDPTSGAHHSLAIKITPLRKPTRCVCQFGTPPKTMSWRRHHGQPPRNNGAAGEWFRWEPAWNSGQIPIILYPIYPLILRHESSIIFPRQWIDLIQSIPILNQIFKGAVWY